MAINRVTIMGNLTRDAELRKKGDATSVLTFGLAINEKKKDRCRWAVRSRPSVLSAFPICRT